jgi:hypothetical protein
MGCMELSANIETGIREKNSIWTEKLITSFHAGVASLVDKNDPERSIERLSNLSSKALGYSDNGIITMSMVLRLAILEQCSRVSLQMTGEFKQKILRDSIEAISMYRATAALHSAFKSAKQDMEDLVINCVFKWQPPGSPLAVDLLNRLTNQLLGVPQVREGYLNAYTARSYVAFIIRDFPRFRQLLDFAARLHKPELWHGGLIAFLREGGDWPWRTSMDPGSGPG